MKMQNGRTIPEGAQTPVAHAGPRSEVLKKLSSDYGCKYARWNRVLNWGGIALLALVPSIVESLRMDPPRPVVAVLASVASLAVLWLSWLSGRSIVATVWLQADHVSVSTASVTFRVHCSDITLVDQPYFRARTSSMAHPSIVRVRTRARTPLVHEFFFVAETEQELALFKRWAASGSA